MEFVLSIIMDTLLVFKHFVICAHKHYYVYTTIRYWFLCLKITWIYQSLFLCTVLGCLLLLFIVLSHSLPCCAAQIFLFVCFQRSWICSPTINQTSPRQSKDWFPFILICRQEKCHWTDPLGLCINHTNMN